jgi:hypothetical protein
MIKWFTKEEDDFLMNNYLLIPAKRMSKMLGRSESGARQRMKLLGIVVPKEVAERFKKESQIKKGTPPPNKGKKWTDYMSEQGMKGSLKTAFKKGTVPPNYKPVGSERTSKDGYIEIKVGEGMRQWRLKHRVVYEQHFGKIPKGYNVEFKDRNRLNISPENLVLRTRKENMKLNSYHNLPKELANTIQLIGALNRQINKSKKRIA